VCSPPGVTATTTWRGCSPHRRDPASSPSEHVPSRRFREGATRVSTPETQVEEGDVSYTGGNLGLPAAWGSDGPRRRPPRLWRFMVLLASVLVVVLAFVLALL
jgi:hypothetical protein